jgi:hypothetical protein
MILRHGAKRNNGLVLKRQNTEPILGTSLENLRYLAVPAAQRTRHHLCQSDISWEGGLVAFNALKPARVPRLLQLLRR